ncbi:MAG TPA: molybdopterin dinucleotide binding domain-containing protein, partial [Intrasporangium sp.]|nr:molybdopterin dinucleotide binding domain-containing protein [Intrasporangium sp.]
GREAAVLRDLRSTEVGTAARAGLAEAGIILVGERAGTSPGALSAAAQLAAETGARLAWVPRRAGERGALEAGALGALLPGGRPMTDAAARGEVAAVWEVDALPDTPARDTAGIIAAAASGDLDALVVGGVDPADLGLSDTSNALQRAFVVSLELRESAVTPFADVVLPVAAQAEKEGSYVNWEGRIRPFELALTTNHVSDHRALDMLAGELGHFLETGTKRQIHDQFEALGPWSGTRGLSASGQAEAAPVVGDGLGDHVLATWPTLLDRGRMQDGEPFLAGTARRATAHLSPGSAERLGVGDGSAVTVTGPRGSVTVPVAVVEGMVDGVVWLPTNSEGVSVRSGLGSEAGHRVSVTASGTGSDPAHLTKGGVG